MPEKPNGSAIVLSQGGGYVHIANSAKVPAYFTAQGFTVFDLIYRLPGEGWKAGADAPKQDGQRAVRLARKLAPQYGLNPNSIGVMGYSAGGHVAATTATTFAQKTYTPLDDADALSARPDFAVLSCPVITMTDPFAHKGSRKLLIGDAPEQKLQDAYSLEKQVTAETPPTFLVHADDDKVVPADNSLLMTLALRRANVPAELHLFREGGHGMGPGLPATLPASLWPTAFARWFERLAAPKA
jgi:acetyl esterase/lipase